MAYYQFTLPLAAEESYRLIEAVCEKEGKVTRAIENKSVEMRTRFRMGKGSLPFAFYLKAREDGTDVMVSLDNTTITSGLTAMNGNKAERVWDLPDKEWSDLIEAFQAEYPPFPLAPGKPEPVAAECCNDGMGQEIVSQGGGVSLGRAAVGGALFGRTGALLGGLSGPRTQTTRTRTAFSGTVLFRVRYSNGRVLEQTVKKNSREYAELMALCE